MSDLTDLKKRLQSVQTMPELDAMRMEVVAAIDVEKLARGRTVTDNELILKALGIARTLTYNDKIQGPAKHIIRELAHRLDRKQRKQRKHNALVRWLASVVHRAWTHNPRRKGT